MNDCFLNLLFSFQLLLPLKEGADFVGSKQTIDVILSDLSLLGYVIPVGGLGIGLFICLLAYLAAEYYNRQIKKFPTEKQNVSLKHILT